MTQEVKGGPVPGCWLDTFETTKFQGRRCRLMGPTQLGNVRSRTDGLGAVVGSAVAGPSAYVRLYSASDDRPGHWLMPKQIVADLSVLPLDDELDSVEILDAPPARSHPGYAGYITALAKISPAR